MLLTEAYDENGIALQKPGAEKGFPTSSEPEEYVYYIYMCPNLENHTCGK